MTTFEAKIAAEDNHAVVWLTGDCDLAARDEMTEVLTAAVSQWHTVLVDLSQVDFLDSSGITALVAAYQAADQYGGDFFVVNPTEMVANVLDITGLSTRFRPPDGYSHG